MHSQRYPVLAAIFALSFALPSAAQSPAEALWWRLVPAHLDEGPPAGTQAGNQAPPNFFSRAVDLMIPAGWKLQGQVDWPGHKGRPKLAFRVDSPDERYGLEYLPQETWTWSEDAATRAGLQASGINVQPLPPTRAADYLRALLLPKLRPGAQIAAIEPLPRITGYLQERLGGSNSIGVNDAERAGVSVPKNSGDAARARISYFRDGVTVEEWIEIAVEHLQRHAPDPAQSLPVPPEGRVYTAPSGPMIDTFIVVECVVLRTPRGRLDEDHRIFESILAKLRQNISWTSRVTYEYWHGRHNDPITYFRPSFFGEAPFTFQDPSDPKYSHSFAYEHVWINEKGDEFIVTGSATFDPNGKMGGQTWKPLKPWKESQP